MLPSRIWKNLKLSGYDYRCLEICQMCRELTICAWIAEELRPTGMRRWVLSRCEEHQNDFSDPNGAWANRTRYKLSDEEIAVLLVMGT